MYTYRFAALRLYICVALNSPFSVAFLPVTHCTIPQHPINIFVHSPFCCFVVFAFRLSVNISAYLLFTKIPLYVLKIT